MSPINALVFLCVFFILNVSNAQNLPRDEYIIEYGNTLNHVIEGEKGSTLVKCVITDPQRVNHELYPEETEEFTIHFNDSLSSCGVSIHPIEKKHEKDWTMRATFEIDGVERQISQIFSVILRGDDTINEKVTLITPRGGSVEFDLDSHIYGNMLFCNVKLPTGTVYEIYPESNVNDPNIVIESYLRCAFKLNVVTLNYTGSWEMSTDVKLFNSNQTKVHQPLDIIIEESIAARPSNILPVLPNYDIEISLSEDVKNLKHCEITSPTEETNVYSSPNCLYSLKSLTPQMNGTWSIRGIGDVILKTDIDILVTGKPLIDTDVTIVHGISTNMTLGPDSAVYCEAIDAQGILRASQSGQCNVNIRTVSFRDAGKWKVNVGLLGAMDLITYEYKIIVEDLGEQNPGRVLTYTKIGKDKKYAEIVCKALVPTMNSCRMIRMDGTVFILNEGIGYGRYKYFVNEERKSENGIDFVQCGIHIDNPTALDFHPWKCIIDHDNIEIGTNLILKNDTTVNLESITELSNMSLTTSNDIGVIIDKEFEMICEYPLKITYCWFRAPNGTVFSVLPDINKENYEYVGDGLAFGHCGIKIKSSSTSDSGTWRCNVGTDAVKDETAHINVNVHNSLMVAEHKEDIWYKGVTFTCKTFDKSPLEYCRFVRPDGRGINLNGFNSTEYLGNGTDLVTGRCELQINYYASADLGRWRCYGKALYKDVEYYDTFVLYNQYWGYYPSATHALAWILFIVVMMGVVVILALAIFKYHAKMALRGQRRTRTVRTPSTRSNSIRHRSSPPPYTPELYQIDEKTPEV